MQPRTKDLFIEALDQPRAARAAWLAVRCADNPTLLADVQSLLDAHDQASILDRGAADLAVTNDQSPRTAAAVEAVGDVIDGRFALVSVLGEGGFGIVYLARQLTPVVRDVALKILRTGLDSHQIVARFDAERQTLALMDHPGIARVYDAGETASGRPYIAMEYVAGEPITTYCDRRGLGIEQRLGLIEQVCHAIQHAHTKGVIHRDLKPGNILVTDLDGKPFPTVIDFGIAKAVDADAQSAIAGNVALTQEFQIVGTPQYMSPEQATRAGTKLVDTRSDIYSIGTVLYELIAGAPPFDPADLRRAGFEGLLRVIRDQTPPRPSTRLATAARTTATRTPGRRVSGDVDWIVMRALEKEPARRYQTAADFAADIRRHLSHEPVLAGPPSRWYSARKFVRRHRPSVAAAAVVTAALLATTVFSIAAARRARAAEAVAVLNRQYAEIELAKANAVVGFTQQLLGGVAPAVARGRDTTLLREVLDEAAKASPKELKDQPMIDLVVRDLIATVMGELGEYESAYALLGPAWDATANVTSDEDARARLVVGPHVADLLANLGRYEDADVLLQALLAECERLKMADSEEAVDVLAQLASLSVDRSQYEQAKSYAQRGMAIVQRALGGDWKRAKMCRDRLANALFFLGNYEAAIENLELNLAATVEHQGPDAFELASIKTSLGAAYKQIGEKAKAETMLREALDQSRQQYEPGNPHLIMSMSVLGDALENFERYDEAARVLEEARAMCSVALPAEHPIVTTVDGRLAKAYAGLGRFDKAAELNQSVLDATLRAEPDDIETVAAVLTPLMQAHNGAKRPAEALACLKTYRPADGWPDSVGPFFRATLDVTEGESHLALGRLDDARRAAASAREWFTKEGRTRGRYIRRLDALDAAIQSATTRPTTVPASLPVN
jgi:eukaryotic-like serine/threonine-protein kinase